MLLPRANLAPELFLSNSILYSVEVEPRRGKRQCLPPSSAVCVQPPGEGRIAGLGHLLHCNYTLGAPFTINDSNH